jgi:hypothetical protein
MKPEENYSKQEHRRFEAPQEAKDMMLKYLFGTIGYESPKSCKCGADGRDLHTCPYKEDIHGDSESQCNCCSDCANECCMNI